MRHEDGGSADRLFQNAVLSKNVDRVVLGSVLMKMRQETRSNRCRTLSKEVVDFHLLMALTFDDLPRMKSDQLARLIRSIVKICLNPKFQERFQVEEYTEKCWTYGQNTSEE